MEGEDFCIKKTEFVKFTKQMHTIYLKTFCVFFKDLHSTFTLIEFFSNKFATF